MEGGKPEYPEKNPRSKDENQQQTQPTYDTGTGNQTLTRATLVEGECSHHCAIPAHPTLLWYFLERTFVMNLLTFFLFTGLGICICTVYLIGKAELHYNQCK